jgi:hypothetical protein
MGARLASGDVGTGAYQSAEGVRRLMRHLHRLTGVKFGSHSEFDLNNDFDPAQSAVQIGRCGYPAPCRAPRCPVRRATIVLRKIDAEGRPVRQIELFNRYAEDVIARERRRGFEIFDRAIAVKPLLPAVLAGALH